MDQQPHLNKHNRIKEQSKTNENSLVKKIKNCKSVSAKFELAAVKSRRSPGLIEHHNQ